MSNQVSKYTVLEFLKNQTASAKEIAKELDYNLNSLVVILSRLKKEKKIRVISNIGKEYVYTINENIENNNININNEPFIEIFNFFLKIMKNGDSLIKSKELWNKIFSGFDKDKIYTEAKRLKLM